MMGRIMPPGWVQRGVFETTHMEKNREPPP